MFVLICGRAVARLNSGVRPPTEFMDQMQIKEQSASNLSHDENVVMHRLALLAICCGISLSIGFGANSNEIIQYFVGFAFGFSGFAVATVMTSLLFVRTSIPDRIASFLRPKISAVLICASALALNTSTLLNNQLAPFDELVRRCLIETYDTSPAPFFIGSICNDGWKSTSTGFGTCSHHGGVNYEQTTKAKHRVIRHEPRQRFNQQECEQQAKKSSWRAA